MNVGVFLDLANLYYQSKRRYNKKIDYKKLYSFMADFGSIELAHAYGSQRDNEAKDFIRKLQRIGFRTIYKKVRELENNIYKSSWDVGLTIDVVRDLGRFDTVILGTGDSDFIPLVNYIKEQNKLVYIVGVDISKGLKDRATDYLSIPSFCMEE